MGLFSYVNDVMEVVGYTCFDKINSHRNFYEMVVNGFHCKVEKYYAENVNFVHLRQFL